MGSAIATVRRSKGVSQRALAHAMAVSETRLCSIERSRSVGVSDTVARQLAVALGCTDPELRTLLRAAAHRHIYGKWACRCCQLALVQEPAEPQIIDGGIPASGLVAHTLISRFVDHLPYYRQETINARSGVHTPRSTLAAPPATPVRRWSRCTRRTSASC